MPTYGKVDAQLVSPLKKLFSHQKHEKTFHEMKVSCVDCHTFSVKSKRKGPLGKGVQGKLLTPPKQICHQCHREKIEVPRPNQCSLCHAHQKQLQPESHYVNWTKRHGHHAQLDSQSCASCHKKSSCTECHIHRDHLNKKVHRGNFKMFHSVQARSNPRSCTMCHRATSFCIDCHKGNQ